MQRKLISDILVNVFKSFPSLRYRFLWLLKIAQTKPNDLIILDYPINSESRYGSGKPAHRELYELINRNRNCYKDLLSNFLSFQEAFIDISVNEGTNINRPCWNNSYFSGLDAIALHCFLCLKNPEHYFEIGSGNSTKFARHAIESYGLRTKITSLDPSPRAGIDDICDVTIREALENVSLDIFDNLRTDDIVFVDNSHRVFMNSDSTVFFLDIFPRLRSGVLVQIHDIFLPDDYPAIWKERYYSEQYLLACYLLAKGNEFEIILPNYFISKDLELAKVVHNICNHPKMARVEKHGVSFWLMKT